MENNIVLIHAGIAVLFALYLLLRLTISLFGLKSPEYQAIMRRKFRIADYCFVGLILVSGLYPIIILGKIELYHALKIILLGLVFWASRISTMNYVGASLLGLLLLAAAGYTSFTDSPVFPKAGSTFEKDHPEVATLSNTEKGRAIFSSICAECHGNDGKKGLFHAADLTLSKLTTEQKIEIVKEGSPLTVMRSFSKELSAKEIEAVVTYVEKYMVEN
ncbi:MAG: cytochrome c [Imperialibacter sp.]|uniref:c-type cytochrome n=1 Tax=Imperialibacter sp. TaxID=2038411 RepID=UPI0032EE1163